MIFQVAFLDSFVLQLIDRSRQPVCAVEKFISGEYVKVRKTCEHYVNGGNDCIRIITNGEHLQYNNNDKWSDDRRNTPQVLIFYKTYL